MKLTPRNRMSAKRNPAVGVALCIAAVLIGFSIGAPAQPAFSPMAKPTKARRHAEVPAHSFLNATCGPRALLLVCEQEKVPAMFKSLCIRSHSSRKGATLEGLAEAARSVGFKAVGVEMDAEAIRHLKVPAVAWVDGNHYIAVLSVTGSTACVHDPNKLRKESVSIATLARRSQGIFLLLSRDRVSLRHRNGDH